MFYRIRSGEPIAIIVLSYLLRVCWGRNVREWLLRRYLMNATHAANFMLLLHDEEVQGWAYPEAVRRWAYSALEVLEASPMRWKYLPAHEWSHYLRARNDFRLPVAC